MLKFLELKNLCYALFYYPVRDENQNHTLIASIYDFGMLMLEQCTSKRNLVTSPKNIVERYQRLGGGDLQLVKTYCLLHKKIERNPKFLN